MKLALHVTIYILILHALEATIFFKKRSTQAILKENM